MHYRPLLVGALALATAFASTAHVRPAAAAGDTIVFGSAVSLTGSLAKEGQLTQEGYDFWKDYVNEHGGIKVGGKSLQDRHQVLRRRVQARQTAAQLAESLINQDKVNFMLGPYGSGTAFSRRAARRAQEDPDGRGQRRGREDLQPGLQVHVRRALAGQALPRRACSRWRPSRSPPAKTSRSRAPDDSFSQSRSRRARPTGPAQHGMKVVYNNKYPDTATDVSSVVSASQGREPGHLPQRRAPAGRAAGAEGLKELNVQRQDATATRSAPTPPTSPTRWARTPTTSTAARSGRTRSSTRATPASTRPPRSTPRPSRARTSTAPTTTTPSRPRLPGASSTALQAAGSLDAEQGARRAGQARLRRRSTASSSSTSAASTCTSRWRSSSPERASRSPSGRPAWPSQADVADPGLGRALAQAAVVDLLAQHLVNGLLAGRDPGPGRARLLAGLGHPEHHQPGPRRRSSCSAAYVTYSSSRASALDPFLTCRSRCWRSSRSATCSSAT